MLDEDEIGVRLAGDPILTPIDNGGVHGALRGPLPIGPKFEAVEDVVDVLAMDTCKFPL